MSGSLGMRILAVLILGLVGCTAEQPDPAVAVSVEELYAHPEKYDGQVISTKGVWVSIFESSQLYTAGPKTTLRNETPGEAVWLALFAGDPKPVDNPQLRGLRAYLKKQERSAAVPLIELELTGRFRHRSQARQHSNGFGHAGAYSSVLEVTRLKDWRSLGSIRIEPQEQERKPRLWQEQTVADPSRSQTLVLRKPAGLGMTFAVEIIVEGQLSTQADLQLLLDEKSIESRSISGNFQTTLQQDWFSDEITVRYVTPEKNSGSVRLRYSFIPLGEVPIKEIFIPPDVSSG